jgi:hypothetical protein
MTRALVRFIDSTGVLWAVTQERVREVRFPALADEPVIESFGYWLYFMSREAVRRVDDFPPDWAERSAEELEEIVNRAEPTRFLWAG